MGTYQLTAGPQVPAAQGTVQPKTGDNGNTRIKLSVQHLAMPDRLTAGSSVFVVWARSPDAAAQNLGTLRVDKDLDGTFDTVTPLRTLELSVTPEASANPLCSDRPDGAAHVGQPALTSRENSSDAKADIVAVWSWLSAAVLGSDDAIVSTASLMIGVAASSASKEAI